MTNDETRMTKKARRRGLTLVEVLMSIFVLSIGLFGVAALLPLGQKKMMEGSINQRSGQVAQAAAEFLSAQGGLNPARWVTSASRPYDAVRVAPASRIVCRATAGSTGSTITTDAVGLDPTDGAYNGGILEFRSGKLRGQQRAISNYIASTKTFSFSNAFPSAPNTVDPPDTFVVYRTVAFALDPHAVGKLGGTAGDFVPNKLPRVTLSTGLGSVTPMPLEYAEFFAMTDEELLFNAPVGSNDPTQIYYNDNANNPIKRKSAMNFSWAAIFVPTLSGNGEQYRVAIVVFYKRPVDAVGAPGGPTAMEVKFTGGGTSGGSAQLRAATASGSPQADLAPVRPGHWVIVSDNIGREHRWYRVLSIGSSYQDTANANRWTRDVTLMGGNWNAGGDPPAGAIAVYYPSVVGVYERTMRIETLPDSG